MKTIITLTLFLFIPICANGQLYRLSLRNVSVREAMKVIKKVTKYNFFIQPGALDELPVTVNLQNASVEQLLDSVVAGQPYEYQIVGNTIRLKLKKSQPMPLRVDTSKAPQLITLQGIILDESEVPIPGATIKLVGDSSKNTCSRDAGFFSMNGIPARGTLTVRCIGYRTRTYPYNGNSVLTLHLTSLTSQLDELEIVEKGYYKTTKGENTGSTANITAIELAKQSVNNPLKALAGKIAGVLVTQTSGVPGSEVKLNIRGRNSIGNGNNPLYVIDGVPSAAPVTQTGTAVNTFGQLINLRNESVKSVEFLKDADATSIYGSRGANGVILITTKKPEAGKTQVDANVYSGFGKVTRKLNLMNTPQYIQMRREAIGNDGIAPGANDHDLNGNWDISPYTDWQKELIGKDSKISNASLTLSGGSEQTSFSAGGTYRHETTTFPGDFYNTMIAGSLSVLHKSEDGRLDFNINVAKTSNIYNMPQTDLTNNIFMSPNAPEIYDAEGQINWQDTTFLNPLAAVHQTSRAQLNYLTTNILLKYQLLRGLQFITNFGYQTTEIEETAITPFSSLLPSTHNAAGHRINNTAENKINSWIFEPQLNYDMILLPGLQVDLMVGATFQQSTDERSYFSFSNFSSDRLLSNPGKAGNTEQNYDSTKYRYTATFTHLGLKYQGKYFLNLTGRRDGSSRYGPATRFGYFGAIGAAWLFHKENFIHDQLSFISFGKLRGSIGTTGNDQLPDYRYRNIYEIALAYDNPGIQPTQLTNPFYKWETQIKREIAVELGLLRNSIFIIASAYRNTTDNQLVEQDLPAFTGFRSFLANIPANVVNKGFELECATHNITSKSFTWESSFNISFPDNRLISYSATNAPGNGKKYMVGYPLGSRMLYHYKGVDPLTGLYSFHDTQEDGKLDENDKIPVPIKQKFFGGFSNTVTYRKVSLDILFQFVKQTGYNDNMGLAWPGWFFPAGSNQPADYVNRWKQPGDHATYQRSTASGLESADAALKYRQSDASITDASFIRLKNISVSWDLPVAWTRPMKIQYARIYMQGQNLLTITNFKGMDPETQQFGIFPSLPPLRMIIAGIQVHL